MSDFDSEDDSVDEHYDEMDEQDGEKDEEETEVRKEIVEEDCMEKKIKEKQKSLQIGVDHYDKDVPGALHLSLEIFLEYFVHEMARFKRKYKVNCPLLTGKGEDKSCKSVEVKFGNKYTLRDLYELFQANPNVIPHRVITHLAVDEITGRLFDRKRYETLEEQKKDSCVVPKAKCRKVFFL